MTKYRLEWEDETDFLAFGIASHQKDFRLAWALNGVLHCDFNRVEDYQISSAKGISSHTHFRWTEAENHFSYHLIVNRGETAYMLPELKQADYVFVIKGMLDALDTDGIKRQINQSEMVLAAFEVDETNAKSIQNLILE